MTRLVASSFTSSKGRVVGFACVVAGLVACVVDGAVADCVVAG
jgi:hypothetical protein